MGAQLDIEVGPREAATAARSRLYQYFSLAVGYPEGEATWRAVVEEYPQNVARIAADLPYALLASDERPAHAVCVLQELQLTYTRLFEAAGGDSVIPLNESEYAHAPRKDVWEDVIRFYEHFGLNYNGTTARNWPDHLSTELECLHYLSFLQSGLPADREPILCAQFDFIERHLLNWLPQVVERSRRAQGSEPYAGLVALLLEFLKADRLYLHTALRLSGRTDRLLS